MRLDNRKFARCWKIPTFIYLTNKLSSYFLCTISFPGSRQLECLNGKDRVKKRHYSLIDLSVRSISLDIIADILEYNYIENIFIPILDLKVYHRRLWVHYGRQSLFWTWNFWQAEENMKFLFSIIYTFYIGVDSEGRKMGNFLLQELFFNT